MRKFLSLILPLFCLLLAACGSIPQETEPAPTPKPDPVMTVSMSDMYTSSELYEATWTASLHLSSAYPDCVVTEIEYNEEYSTARKSELKDAYKNPSTVVVLADLTTGTQVDGTMQPNTTYTDVEIVLTLAEDGRTWLVQDLLLP